MPARLVVDEPRRGFGAACWAGLGAADPSDGVVCFMDGDGSLDPADLALVAAPVLAGAADLVLGARRPTTTRSWPLHARVANAALAWELRRRTGVQLRDLGAMRAARCAPLRALGLQDRRSGWPLEMVLLASDAGWRIDEVAVPYAAADRPLEGHRHRARDRAGRHRHACRSASSRPGGDGRAVTITTGAGIPLVDADRAPLLARPYYAAGDPGPIVTALAHVPEVLEAAMPFISVILGPSSIALRPKELVILRTSARLGCRFCVNAHTVAAADAGLSRPELLALRGEVPIDDVFVDATERAVLQWVDAVAAVGPVASGARDALAARVPAHEVVELTLLAGATMMLNRFCTALDLPTAPAILGRLHKLGLP